MLRDYQKEAIAQFYSWIRENEGDPCLVLPTGAGKSWVIAEICRDAIARWPETKVLLLTHQKELIVQDYEKLMMVWPDAPAGIYSASLKRREMDSQVLFAGVQSVRNRAHEIGFRNLIIVDECHLISHKEAGVYRTLIDELRCTNPRLRVLGLTATPWRLGHGCITDGDALFDGLIEPVSIMELIAHGFLSPLRSKATKVGFDLSGVHKRGGEFIEHELANAVDTEENNRNAVLEALQYAGDRKSWLFFCSGVEHAKNVREMLTRYGITAGCVTGDTPQEERDQMLLDFKSGKIRAMTNVNVLTTGFDHPGIDLIAMMRPTMSPTLYMQMAGRGLRVSEGKTDCLVLDFAGNVSRHGPITDVVPPAKKGEGTGEAPIKVCEGCGEICSIAARVCPCCGLPFPIKEKPKLVLDTEVDIMGRALVKEVKTWIWRVHTSKASGKDLLKVTYYSGLSQLPLTEYFSVMHDGYAGDRSRRELVKIASACGVSVTGYESLIALVALMNQGRVPAQIEYKKNGKYDQVIRRIW